MNNGWIKLHRKLLSSDMYQSLNSKQRDILITCLLLANHQDKEWAWGSNIFKCEPGQFVTSLESLANKCASDVTVRNIRTTLVKLEKWEFLTNKSTKTGRLITVLNWHKYQGFNTPTDKQVTKTRQRGDKDLTTNKNVKNDKEFNINFVHNKNIERWQHKAEQLVGFLDGGEDKKSSIFKCCKENFRAVEFAIDGCTSANNFHVDYFLKCYHNQIKRETGQAIDKPNDR